MPFAMQTSEINHTGGDPSPTTGGRPGGTVLWKQTVICYHQPSNGRAIWQLVNTLAPISIGAWNMQSTIRFQETLIGGESATTGQ